MSKKIDVSRYVSTKEIHVDVKVLTPMFLGGANGQAELRSASIKSMLRFWWRALYGNTHENEITMKAKEDELFGNTERKSPTIVNVTDTIAPLHQNLPKGKTYTVEGKNFKPSIIDYMAYGLHEYIRKRGNVYKRSHLPPGKSFTIYISCNNPAYNEILNSLYALIKYGGLGSKNRNGFGALHNNTAYTFSIENFFRGELKTFPTANNKSRLFETKAKYEKWEDALSDIGLIYKNARLSLENKHSYTKRGYVARPIVVKHENIPNNIETERHAKSYFLSIDEENGKYKGQILFMPVEHHENHKDYMEVYEQMNAKIEKHFE